MANHPDALKQNRKSIKRRARNREVTSYLHTLAKRLAAAVEAKKSDEAKASLAAVTREYDRAVTKGVLHRNTASRKISRLTLQVKKALAAEKSA